MDGFVLPPFESSCVLKDKDIVWLVSPKLSPFMSCKAVSFRLTVQVFVFLFVS